MSIAAAKLTAARLREVLDYDRETGVFRWRLRTSNRVHVGDVAGTPNKNRIELRVDGVHYQAHRLAWLHVTGSWPAHEIDHKDGDPGNNAFGNLRDVPRKVNQENLRKARTDNQVGLLGVCAARGKFKASLGVGGKHKHLGYFPTPEVAHAVYLEAKRRLHEGCTL